MRLFWFVALVLLGMGRALQGPRRLGTRPVLGRVRRLTAGEGVAIPTELLNEPGGGAGKCKSSCEDGPGAAAATADGAFVSTSGPVTAADLADENLVKIVSEEASDADVNVLLWKCLGYRYNAASSTWTSEEVFPKWAAKFPSPPDLIGVTRRYDPETDKIVRNASMDLMRSIPRDFKGGVRSLSRVGWKGFKLSELTPNKTRRAQSANWLIYYREKLLGKSLEELQAARLQEQPAEKDVADLPSEKHYQSLRLDGPGPVPGLGAP